jgi:hypothetical protein
MIKLKENYRKNLSDREKDILANTYFSIGHDPDDSEEQERHWCWLYRSGILYAKKGGTHGNNFGETDRDMCFRGWYDVDKNIISVVFPEYELRKLGDKEPTQDDIPQHLYSKLIEKFKFRAATPGFFVLESVILKEEEERKIPVVVGIVTPEGEIHSAKKLGTTHSIEGYHFGDKWRYNPETQIVYWSTQNWSNQSDEDMVAVENHLFKKYNFEVKSHIDLSTNFTTKNVFIAHGEMKEVTQKDIKSRLPRSAAVHRIADETLNHLTLDNLKGIRNKIVSVIKFCQKQECTKDEMTKLFTDYQRYDNEIKRRLRYINKLVIQEVGDRGSLGKFYWLDSMGHLHRVPQEGHAPWGMLYLKSIGYPFSNMELLDVYNIMFKMGWIRVSLLLTTSLGSSLSISHTLPLTSIQKEVLNSLAKENDVDQIVDDSKKRRINIDDLINENIILNERMTFADLYDETDEDRLTRSKTIRVRPLDVDTDNNNEMWRFNYTSAEKTEGKSHKGNIHFFKENVEQNDNAEDLECMVDCSCRDFKYRWAYANAQDDASFIGGRSLNKCINRPPRRTNPTRHKQLCKHLAGLAKYLKTNLDTGRRRARLRNRLVNIFESMDELANKGHFQATYNDNE